MRLRNASSVPTIVGAVLVAAGATATADLRAAPADDNRVADEVDAGDVPAVPDGTPRQLLDFADGLRRLPAARESLARQKLLAAAAVEAADRALAGLEPGDELCLAALRVKLDALDTLAVGDPRASAARRDCARSLCDSPAPAIALEGRLRLLVADVLEMHWSRSTAGGAALVDSAAELLGARPDDEPTAARLARWAGSLEAVPGDGAALAERAYAKLAPMLAASGSPRNRALAERLDGKRRLLQLPGRPLALSGGLVDGGRFDVALLRGKVVIVDFWATWCGPCMADIPALRGLDEDHRERGLEVVLVSLDSDVDAVQDFIRDANVTWPILFDGATEAFSNPLAASYGITSIPLKILVGRDGNVVSIHRSMQTLEKAVEALLRP